MFEPEQPTRLSHAHSALALTPALALAAENDSPPEEPYLHRGEIRIRSSVNPVISSGPPSFLLGNSGLRAEPYGLAAQAIKLRPPACRRGRSYASFGKVP